MDKKQIERALNGLLDDLAAIEHDRWSHWQDYMHGKGRVQSDGSLVIPADLVERWQKQMATPYAELSAKERESDRDQVRKYLPLIIETLSR
jgi:hypothetical protein